MKISVVICTYNPREDYLNRVLEALKNQTFPMQDWELLLIDNASQPPLSNRFNLSWHPHGRNLLEPKVGKLNAWLLGIRESNGEIIVFVDDDNVLAKDFLQQTLAISEQWPFIGAWSGSMIPEFEKPLPQWVGDKVWQLGVVEVKEDIWSNLRDGCTIPWGAGMCIRKNVGQRYLEWCGLNKNSLALDRTGNGRGGYGDTDLGHCALDIGLGAGKFTRLRLTHLIPAERLTLDYFVRKAEGDAESLFMLHALRNLPIQKPEPPNFINSLRWFVHRMIHQVPREQYEIQKAYQRGSLKGWELAQAYLKTKNTK